MKKHLCVVIALSLTAYAMERKQQTIPYLLENFGLELTQESQQHIQHGTGPVVTTISCCSLLGFRSYLSMFKLDLTPASATKLDLLIHQREPEAFKEWEADQQKFREEEKKEKAQKALASVVATRQTTKKLGYLTIDN